MFLIFDSQEERREYGGSGFVEIQFCELPAETDIKEIVSVYNMRNWLNSSLYVHMSDMDEFYEEYGHIFDCGVYNNLKSGNVDLYGINYYAPSLTESIIEKIRIEKPTEHDVLIEWLKKTKNYNGFYILGI